MIARIILANIIFFTTCVELSAQVFHYKTGKVVLTENQDTVVWKAGIFNGYPANFGTFVVPETNKRNANPIAIPIINLPCIDSTLENTPVFILNGGPGESNLRQEMLFDSLIYAHDVYLLGYRGVDGTTQLECPAFKRFLYNESINKENTQELLRAAFNQCKKDWDSKQIDIDGYTMDYVVQDMYRLLEQLQISRVNLYAYSYGTMVAQLFSKEYPNLVNKMVFIGSRPLGNFIFTDESIDRQLQLIEDSIFQEPGFKQWCKVIVATDTIIQSNTVFKSLFVFGSLYSKKGIDKMYQDYKMCATGNKKAIKQSFKKFQQNFPGEMVIGDMLLKKQGRLNLFDIKNQGLPLVQGLNDWYNFNVNSFSFQSDSMFVDSCEVLVVNSQFDIASPAELVKEKILNYYPNAEVISVPNAGHLDLFFNEYEYAKVKLRIIHLFSEN